LLWRFSLKISPVNLVYLVKSNKFAKWLSLLELALILNEINKKSIYDAPSFNRWKQRVGIL
jgi:hypothetical protein